MRVARGAFVVGLLAMAIVLLEGPEPSASSRPVGSGQVADSRSIPPLPFVDRGACPFEGCTYRDWCVLADTTLLRGKQDRSPVAGKVKKGDVVRALTGVVITTKLGEALVVRPVRLGRQQISMMQGDRVALLNYLGEGEFKIWLDGEVDSAFIPDEASCQRSPALFNECAIQLASFPTCVWWVKIQTRDGLIGWTREHGHFCNKDRFG